ncbi:MAG: DUF4870 domain-containing protein [Gammaproteobacteria bacterium]|nr:DUF4870 domain-containing protein [Gammaproteobacteria bacterium]
MNETNGSEPGTTSPVTTESPQNTHPDNGLALLTHLSGIVLAWIVPLVVWLVCKDDGNKAYLTAESKEALNFQITVFIGYLISWILMIVVIGFILWWIVWVLNLIFCIIAAIQVSQRGSYRYPLTWRLIT